MKLKSWTMSMVIFLENLKKIDGKQVMMAELGQEFTTCHVRPCSSLTISSTRSPFTSSSTSASQRFDVEDLHLRT